MAATHPFYSTTDLATKLIPALAPMTLDKEKEVRDHVFKTLHLFLDKLERISEDPVAAQEQEKAEGRCSYVHVTHSMCMNRVLCNSPRAIKFEL